MNAAQMFLACWIIACHQVINAEELRAAHPELYADETKLLQWNVERHVWKKSPRLEDGRRVNLWDVKVGPTLAHWQKESRTEPGQREPIKCGRHITRKIEEPDAEMLEDLELGKETFFEVPRVPVVAPMPFAYGEPYDETEKKFWERWNSTLSPTERKELRPLSDFVMMKSRRPLTDDLPEVPDRRTKVTKRKDTKTEIEAARSAIGDIHMANAVAECMESGSPYATAKIVAEREGLSYLALKQHIARARRVARKSVTFLRVPVEDCKERAA